jgi:orotate phosphoribosyltransferase
VGILKAAVAPPKRVDLRAVVVSVDRMERGQTDRSALAEIAEAFLVRTFAIVTLDDVVEHLHGREVDGRVLLTDDMRGRIEDYRARYGAR